MNTNDIEVREFWNQTAQDWHIHVGEDGDSNRLLNSDPILWTRLGRLAFLSKTQTT